MRVFVVSFNRRFHVINSDSLDLMVWIPVWILMNISAEKGYRADLCWFQWLASSNWCTSQWSGDQVTVWTLYLTSDLFLSGKTQRPAQRVSFKPPAAEPICHLHHGVRLASPTRETYSGLLRVWSNCESCFTDFNKKKKMPCFFDQIQIWKALLFYL